MANIYGTAEVTKTPSKDQTENASVEPTEEEVVNGQEPDTYFTNALWMIQNYPSFVLNNMLKGTLSHMVHVDTNDIDNTGKSKDIQHSYLIDLTKRRFFYNPGSGVWRRISLFRHWDDETLEAFRQFSRYNDYKHVIERYSPC